MLFYIRCINLSYFFNERIFEYIVNYFVPVDKYFSCNRIEIEKDFELDIYL